MATKYSDIIKLRALKPAYNIEREEKGEWSVFIANKQFNDVLRKVISSVRNDNKDVHKSFWISGTYGSGKSHAGSVLMHLLCDDIDDVREWIDTEYGDKKYEQIRLDLYNLRKSKRLLPIQMYGQSNISHVNDLSLQIQKAVKQALKKAGIELTVKTDFDNYAEHIHDNPDIWDVIINNNNALRSVAPDRDRLIAAMRNQDISTLNKAEEALSNSRLDVRLDASRLTTWFFDVQNRLREVSQGKYNGLLVVWDEFTAVAQSDIGLSLLTELQGLQERVEETVNDSYFLLISHPSAFGSIKAEERNKTIGRYHYMVYNMEQVSAFKIMSRKFLIEGTDEEYYNMTHGFFELNADLYDTYSSDSTSPAETRHDIENLFPLHPSTVNLAAYYARQAGSSSRSVFEFLGDSNPAIKEFLNNEHHYSARDTITADYLWDFVLSEFESNVQQYGSVTERFNSYRQHVSNKGGHYFAVFKGILLLNALNNVAGNESVTPSETNIRQLFKGTSMEGEMYEILAWLNSEGVVQRDPSGLYMVQFSALPVTEIAEIKERMKGGEFRFTSSLINYGDSSKLRLFTCVRNVMRAWRLAAYSLYSNEPTLLNAISKGREKSQPYELFFAALVSRDNDERSQLQSIAERAAVDVRFSDVIFLLFDRPFGADNYERFIEYVSNAQCAQQHGFGKQKDTYSRNAQEMVGKWMDEIRRGNVTVYVRDNREIVSGVRLADFINTTISSIIYSSGPEALDTIRESSSQTYWKKALVRGTVKNVLIFNTKTDITDHCNGPARHIGMLLQDSVDENLEWKADIDERHPLKQVCDFVDKKIKNAGKADKFNLAEKLIDLTRPPFGLYQTHSGMGMLAFAMRKYAGKVFDINGKPRKAELLVDDVVETFRCWESGTTSPKVTLKFETPEENKMCKALITLFDLRNNTREYTDISSLKDARWAINAFVKDKGYPLWSVKYSATAFGHLNTEDLNTVINNIVKICHETGIIDPHIMTVTLKLIKDWKYELTRIVNNAENYKQGFATFMKSVSVVNLQDGEINEAIDYIGKHTQSERGTWSEDEVTIALKDWRIEKNSRQSQPLTPPSSQPQNGQTSQPYSSLGGSAQRPQPTYVAESSVAPTPNYAKQEEAREKVKDMDADTMRTALDNIIDLGYEQIYDILLES